MAGNIPGEMEAIWSSFLLLSIPYRPWLWLSALVLACGALSICWRAMDRITLDRMLMYDKEANNRKQEIDRQHRTIPRKINMKESLCRENRRSVFDSTWAEMS